MVVQHMASLIAVSDDCEVCVTKYLSEPILVEASAYITTYGIDCVDVLDVVMLWPIDLGSPC